MNSGQIEKLKSLIHSSRILNEGERAEWLTLLELMNDKQLGELEKILASGQQSASSIQHIVESEKKTAQPVKPHMPNLSHIMNLPKTLDGQAPVFKLSQKTMGMPLATVKTGKDQGPSLTTKTIKQKQSFSDRLKAIFAEKELPSGKPENELSLPDHITQPKDEKNPSVIVADKVVIRGPVKLSSPIGAGSLPKDELSKMPAQVTPAVLKPAILPQQPIKKNPEPLSSVLKPISKPVFPAAKPAGVARPSFSSDQGPKNAPGLNIQETSEKIRQDTLAGIKQRMGEAVLPKMATQNKSADGKPVDFHEPKDLEKLTLADFQKASLDSLVLAIKSLIRKHGYYEVVFNIEKSLLYQVYIKTGLELMNKQETFETLSSAQEEDSILDREGFEKFTDLLRMIASS